ncbi:MAG: MFS transporter, partial [Anaerovorax sp.]
MVEKLSLKTKFAYGVAAIGDAGSYTILGTFLMFFLTTVAGINPVTAGTIAAMGSVWDAVCSPIIGYISDNRQSKYGRRIPFMFFAAFPLGVSCSMLFASIDASYALKVLYYGVLVIVFWTAFSAFFIPYMAMGAEITNDYDERTSLRSTTYGFNIVGMVIGMVMPTLIVDFLLNREVSLSHAWHGAGMIVGAMAALSILYTCFILGRKKQTPTPFRGQLREKGQRKTEEKKPGGM